MRKGRCRRALAERAEPAFSAGCRPHCAGNRANIRVDLAGVRAEWRATIKKEPPGALTRGLLVHQLAWRIRERAFVGHDAATLKLLDAYGRQCADKIGAVQEIEAGYRRRSRIPGRPAYCHDQRKRLRLAGQNL